MTVTLRSRLLTVMWIWAPTVWLFVTLRKMQLLMHLIIVLISEQPVRVVPTMLTMLRATLTTMAT